MLEFGHNKPIRRWVMIPFDNIVYLETIVVYLGSELTYCCWHIPGKSP